jgi:serine protease Do
MILRISLVLLGALALWLQPIARDSCSFSCSPLKAEVSAPLPDSPNFLHHTPLETLKQQTRQITVKVLASDTWGSGILIGQHQSVYTVLTNHHVLQGRSDYRVQTPDGRSYAASNYQGNNFSNNDLALLQFISTDTSYVLAAFSRRELAAGEAVFAAGFPIESDRILVHPDESDPEDQGFRFTSGQVVLVSEKALRGGYQLGYTNDIEKGMSGGPVLNASGEVIAINGMHAYPLWGDPYIFADGSRPCDALHQLMEKTSWAIPTETFLSMIPDALLAANPASIQVFPPLSSSEPTPEAVSTTQASSSASLQQIEASELCKPQT